MLLSELHVLECARRSGSRRTYLEVSLGLQDVIEQHMTNTKTALLFRIAWVRAPRRHCGRRGAELRCEEPWAASRTRDAIELALSWP